MKSAICKISNYVVASNESYITSDYHILAIDIYAP